MKTKEELTEEELKEIAGGINVNTMMEGTAEHMEDQRIPEKQRQQEK